LPVVRGLHGEIRTCKVYRHDQRCEAAEHVDVVACKTLPCACKTKILMATILALQLTRGKAGEEPGAEPEPVGEFDPHVVMMVLCIIVGVVMMVETWRQEGWQQAEGWSQESPPPTTETRWCCWSAPPPQDTQQESCSGASSSHGAGSAPSGANTGTGPKKRTAVNSDLLYTGHGSRDEDDVHTSACPLRYEKSKSFRSCYHCRPDRNGDNLVWVTKFGACYHNRVNCSGLDDATSRKTFYTRCSCCST